LCRYAEWIVFVGDRKIGVEKLGRVRVVGVDAPDFRRRDNHHLGLLGAVKRLHLRLVGQIEFLPRPQQQRHPRLSLEMTH